MEQWVFEIMVLRSLDFFDVNYKPIKDSTEEVGILEKRIWKKKTTIPINIFLNLNTGIPNIQKLLYVSNTNNWSQNQNSYSLMYPDLANN